MTAFTADDGRAYTPAPRGVCGDCGQPITHGPDTDIPAGDECPCWSQDPEDDYGRWPHARDAAARRPVRVVRPDRPPVTGRLVAIRSGPKAGQTPCRIQLPSGAFLSAPIHQVILLPETDQT